MDKKCRTCGIVLDVPCMNQTCAGHQNESVGDLCSFCATNQREELFLIGDLPCLFFSSLGGLDVDSQKMDHDESMTPHP